MISRVFALCAIASAALTAPLFAATALHDAIARAPKPLQCVPYARAVTGVRIHGDAHTWWGQARGQYARGNEPQVGAVMNFRPHGRSRLGHVAAVSKVIDDRTVLISHANWSVRGGIERNVKAVDVSAANDWSRVRVWNGNAKKLGGSAWPLYGFIYNGKGGKGKAAKLATIEKHEVQETTTNRAEWPVAKRERRTERRVSKSSPRRSSDPIGAIIARQR
jgi:surface antigen